MLQPILKHGPVVIASTVPETIGHKCIVDEALATGYPRDTRIIARWTHHIVEHRLHLPRPNDGLRRTATCSTCYSHCLARLNLRNQQVLCRDEQSSNHASSDGILGLASLSTMSGNVRSSAPTIAAARERARSPLPWLNAAGAGAGHRFSKLTAGIEYPERDSNPRSSP